VKDVLSMMHSLNRRAFWSVRPGPAQMTIAANATCSGFWVLTGCRAILPHSCA